MIYCGFHAQNNFLFLEMWCYCLRWLQLLQFTAAIDVYYCFICISLHWFSKKIPKEQQQHEYKWHYFSPPSHANLKPHSPRLNLTWDKPKLWAQLTTNLQDFFLFHHCYIFLYGLHQNNLHKIRTKLACHWYRTSRKNRDFSGSLTFPVLLFL